MFRLLAVTLLVALPVISGTSCRLPFNANGIQITNYKFCRLQEKVQALTNRLNSARVHCDEKVTSWDLRSDAYIKYLDRQNFECPNGSFLARFRLVREGDYGSARVRYLYRCCKFIL